MSTPTTGLVFNIQKFSVSDGPGIRTTVFLKGCPLRCSWCHNPEGLSPQPELLVVENRCAACGACRAACPFGQAIAGSGVLPARNKECILCDRCVEACPSGARQRVGRAMTVDEVLAEILKDKIFYDESGGGATFSGGEPLTQAAFVLELLKECKAHGVRTALDTCGFGCTEDLLALGRLADLVLFDVKLMDDARHRQHCGVPNAPILANLRALAEVHDHVWLRVPVIPDVTDDTANLTAIAQLAASLSCVRQVCLLPYHHTGLSKHARVGHKYAHADLKPPSDERMSAARNIFREHGVETKP
jgi:pyruvate formate lyase activating enzyme